MSRKDRSILDLLVVLPWWVSVILSGTVFIILKFIIPALVIKNPILKGYAQLTPLASIISLALLIPALISLFDSLRKRKLLDSQKDLDSIRSLSWKEFEELVGYFCPTPRKGTIRYYE